jgi:hypothetical protein
VQLKTVEKGGSKHVVSPSNLSAAPATLHAMAPLGKVGAGTVDHSARCNMARNVVESQSLRSVLIMISYFPDDTMLRRCLSPCSTATTRMPAGPSCSTWTWYAFRDCSVVARAAPAAAQAAFGRLSSPALPQHENITVLALKERIAAKMKEGEGCALCAQTDRPAARGHAIPE